MRQPKVSSRADRTIDVVLWTAGVLLAVTILAYSFVVTPPRGGAFAISDKVLHAASYFATGLCLLLAAVWRPGRGDGPFPTWRLRGAVALVTTGALIEVVQGTFISRQAEFADVVADLIGVSAALLLHGSLRRMASAR